MAVAFLLESSISPKIPAIVLCMVSIIVRMLCIIAIIGGIWATICGMSTSIWSRSLMTIVHLLSKLIDTVERIEYGSQRKTDRNIVAMLFPVEVAADRPPDILEIRTSVAQFIDDRGDFFCYNSGMMSYVVKPQHQFIHALRLF